jgi:hypothetical protein
LAIRERELFADNCRHIEAQAALLAGVGSKKLMQRHALGMHSGTFFGGMYQLAA